MEQQENSTPRAMTEAEIQDWVRAQFQRANMHLA